MGLKITSELYTDAGVSSEVYVNIETIKIVKKNQLIVSLNNYLNKSAREDNERDTILCRQLYSSICVPLTSESDDPDSIDSTLFTELTTTYIHEFAYSKVKEKLTGAGLTVEDEI